MAAAHWEMLKKVDGVPRALFDEFCRQMRCIARYGLDDLRWKSQRFRFRCRLTFKRIGSALVHRS